MTTEDIAVAIADGLNILDNPGADTDDENDEGVVLEAVQDFSNVHVTTDKGEQFLVRVTRIT